MARRVGPIVGGIARPERAARSVSSGPSYASKNERLVEIIDQCTAAKATADAIGDRFLSYLLAMTIQEARSAMRPTLPNLTDGNR